MRLRIKQQFWRVADDALAMRRILLQRFTSLTHLMRAALALRGFDAPIRRARVIDAAVAHLGLDAAFASSMTTLRQPRRVPPRDELVTLFGGLPAAIRVVDDAIGGPVP